ncbi:hypothetical protein ACFPK9_11760 [Rubritalea spongiae]|uniref:PA14 domain-containing protein n=1 Tax=Rubritalea spongiae TaxID=430797 RepID=A0ABW5E387_9BACT
MSLHANISTEAQQALDSQKKKSTLYSILISLLICALLVIILSILVMATVNKKTPELIAYPVGISETTTIEKPEIVNEVSRKPTAPSQIASVIATDSSASMSVPTVDFSVNEASLDFGAGDDFGLGFDGDAWGSAGATGAAGGFGSNTKVLGTIQGHFYDFKQTADGEPNARYKPMSMASMRKKDGGSFSSVFRKIRNSNFSDSSFRGLYKAERPLYARYIAIPPSSADLAPKQFGQEGKVEPSNWLIHYQGKIKAPKNGTFRFVGQGDDIITVNLNRKSVFTSALINGPLPGTVTVKGNSTGPDVESWRRNVKLDYGAWFSVREGEELDIDLVISEAPGGQMYFGLMIEEKGAEYRKGKGGRDILPPFTMGHLEPEDKAAIKKFPNWEWELDNVPVFMATE